MSSAASIHRDRARGRGPVVAVSVLLLALLSACGGGDADATAKKGADSPIELRVGAVYPATGANATFAAPMIASAELAVDVANDAATDAGIGSASVSWLGVEDDQNETAGAVDAANKIVTTDKADVVIGGLNSALAIAMAQSVMIPKSAVLICTGAGSPAITALEDNGMVARILPSDAQQVPALVSAAEKAFGKDATLNIGYSTDTFGEGIGVPLAEQWVANGGTIGEKVTFDAEATSYDSEAQALASGSPDGWLITTIPDVFAKLAPALVRTGDWQPDKTIVNSGMRSPAQLEAIGATQMAGLQGVAPTASSAPAKAAFDTLMAEQASGVERGPYDAASFDAVILSFLAAVRGGAADAATVAENLADVSSAPGTKYTFEQLPDAVAAVAAGEDIDYEGAWSSIDLDDAGDPTITGWEMWQYSDGAVAATSTFVVGQ